MTGDLAWLGTAIDKHYAGDDSDLGVIIQALLGLTDGVSVEDYARSVTEFYRSAQHPILGRPYADSVYTPMVELLRYLEAHGFTCYIVSGGERDFMRPMTQANYGVPPERVIGSALGLTYDEKDASVRYSSALAFFDDGPEKPVRIWSRIGRRPLLAAGNSNGDMPMLDFAHGGPRRGLALLIHHDDAGRDDTPTTREPRRPCAQPTTAATPWSASGRLGVRVPRPGLSPAVPGGQRAQRKPMWVMAVSSACADRAAGR